MKQEMIDKIEEATKLIEEIRKSDEQDIWVQADTVLMELESLCYQVELHEK